LEDFSHQPLSLVKWNMGLSAGLKRELRRVSNLPKPTRKTTPKLLKPRLTAQRMAE